MLGVDGAAEVAAWCQAWEGERRGGGEGLLGPQGGSQAPARHGPCSLQEEAKAKEEEGVPDEEGWVKVTRRGRRPVLPRTEAASLRVLERERRKRARKELLNFYAWQHRETKMERKAPQGPCPSPHCLRAWAVVLWPLCQPQLCGASWSVRLGEGSWGSPSTPKAFFLHLGLCVGGGGHNRDCVFLIIIWFCWVLNLNRDGWVSL